MVPSYTVTVNEYTRIKDLSNADRGIRTAMVAHVIEHAEGKQRVAQGDRFYLHVSVRGSGR